MPRRALSKGGALLRKHNEVLRTLCAIADLGVVVIAWAAAYALRFLTQLGPPPPAPPVPGDYLVLGAFSLPLFHVLLRSQRLYEPRRGQPLAEEARRLISVTTLGTLAVAAATFFGHSWAVSRLVILLFWALSSLGLVLFRVLLRLGLAEARRRGHNTRNVLIVGTGPLGREVHARLAEHPEMGFVGIGFLGPSGVGLGTASLPPRLGGIEALRSIVTREDVDQVIIALDRGDPTEVDKLVGELADTTAAVRIVPDLQGMPTVSAGIDDLDGLAMIRLVESPVLGWDRLLKRALDVAVSGSALVLLAPLLGGIAAAIRLTSGAPVIYRQQRASLDGHLFTMLKFRSMVADAESDGRARWAVPDDPRRTRLGAFLRRTNLDELPQLWNVLRGELSLVGPRPERPEFIHQFRARLPGYMLRHKVKGGLTGWAQVHGLRGNTSVEKRLEYDLEYAQRWSLSLDLRILWLTLRRGFRDPNAY